MCNCSKPVTKTECERLKKFHTDPEKRFFIYHIFNEGLKVRMVPPGINPNTIAQQAGFYNEAGQIEFYHVSEHPCIHE